MTGDGAARRERQLVLLVDDSADTRGMYAEYLELEGFAVVEAEDGADAVAVTRRERPDVVVMDLGLPTLDGIGATKLLRAEAATRDVVVIVLSGHGPEMAERAREAGIDRFVRKPCLPGELVAHLRSALGARGSTATR